MAASLAGTRIRQRRRSVGLSQKALAAQAGISPSYLNLIEHNRRAIAGRVLNAIARALDTPPRDLAEGPEGALIAALQEASGGHAGPLENIEDLVARFPGWSTRLAELSTSNSNQARLIETLGDRLTHDPYLSESLHLMLSSITAIRSTASLMTSVDNMPAEQSRRFNQNIHAESLRLSEAVQELVSYFDSDTQEQQTSVTPEEEFDQFWAALRPQLGDPEIGTLGADLMTGLSGPARTLARTALDMFASDAEAMPLGPFLRHANDVDFAPDQLAAFFGMDLHSVFRRLTTLPEGPAFGLIEIDASGHIQTRRPLPDFPLPRHTSGCTLWPLYQCLQQPGRALRDVLQLPGDACFQSYAVALPTNRPEFGAPVTLRAAMLIRPLDQKMQTGALPVGTVCKLCPRRDCPGRSEPQIMAPA